MSESNPFKKEVEEKQEEKQEGPAGQIGPAGHHLHFKPGVDFNEVNELYQMLKSGALMDNRVHALDKALWIAGGLNAYFDSHDDPQVFAQISVPNEFQGEGGLDQRIGEELAEEPTRLNPVLASLIKRLVMMILEQLLA